MYLTFGIRMRCICYCFMEVDEQLVSLKGCCAFQIHIFFKTKYGAKYFFFYVSKYSSKVVLNDPLILTLKN